MNDSNAELGSVSRVTSNIIPPALLQWEKQPKKILVIKKLNCGPFVVPFMNIVTWLVNRDIEVFIEEKILSHDDIKEDSIVLEPLLKFLECKKVKEFIHKDHANELDMAISIGGDGTVINASWLLQEVTPPVMGFGLGVHGFLTPFEYFSFKDSITRVFEGKCHLHLRNRLVCSYQCHNLDKQYLYVMNEVVIRRCLSPYAKNVLELYIDGKRILFRGDGLIVATPTGSTAYAINTGASIIHPHVPAILITPICSQKLSFRSILVPVTSRLKILLSPKSKTTATLSCDGHYTKELSYGDSVWITHSDNPFKAIIGNINAHSKWFATVNCFLTSGGSNSLKRGDGSNSSSENS